MLSIPQLLKDFGKQNPAFAGDAKKVDLLVQYLLLRLLSPTLTFETFLACYSSSGLADPEKAGVVDPLVILDDQLPRSKSVAARLSRRQWSAKEVVGFVSLYVDMIREAEQTNTDVPMTVYQWLSSEVMQGKFLSGDFDETDDTTTPVDSTTAATATEAAQPPFETSAESKTAPVPANTVANPSPAKRRSSKSSAASLTQLEPGDRVLYEHVGGTSFRGVVSTVVTEGGRHYATIDLDSGELVRDVSVVSCKKINDPPARVPHSASNLPLPQLGNWVVELEPDELQTVRQYLSQKRVESAEPNAVLWPWTDSETAADNVTVYQFHVSVVNGNDESGVYVDAYVCTKPENAGEEPVVLYELPPRVLSLEGNYDFVIPNVGYYRFRLVLGADNPS